MDADGPTRADVAHRLGHFPSLNEPRQSSGQEAASRDVCRPCCSNKGHRTRRRVIFSADGFGALRFLLTGRMCAMCAQAVAPEAQSAPTRNSGAFTLRNSNGSYKSPRSVNQIIRQITQSNFKLNLSSCSINRRNYVTNSRSA